MYPGLKISGAITVEAWIKLNSIGAYQVILSHQAFQQPSTGCNWICFKVTTLTSRWSALPPRRPVSGTTSPGCSMVVRCGCIWMAC